MSDETPTQTGDLGEMPDAEIEPGEPNPGGVDALPEPVVPHELHVLHGIISGDLPPYTTFGWQPGEIDD